nr:MAG TPA: hypothetical protein [Crassvirales sp.]
MLNKSPVTQRVMGLISNDRHPKKYYLPLYL